MNENLRKNWKFLEMYRDGIEFEYEWNKDGVWYVYTGGLLKLSHFASSNISFREIDPYKHLRDAVKAGKQIEYLTKDGDWNPINIENSDINELYLTPDRYRIVEPDQYQKYREAEKAGKVVQAYNDNLKCWLELGEHEPRYYNDIKYRIMQYVPFEVSDLKDLYKRDVINSGHIVDYVIINIDNKQVYHCGKWFTLDEAFEEIRFYDPTKSKFEAMPVFGKLIEVKE